MTTLSEIGEDALIARLTRLLPRDPRPAAGPGDDCAVVDPGPECPRVWLLKTDAVVGGAPDSFVPFKPGTKVGRREGRGPFRFKGEGRGPFQW